mgnify:CR=1 FL=1
MIFVKIFSKFKKKIDFLFGINPEYHLYVDYNSI